MTKNGQLNIIRNMSKEKNPAKLYQKNKYEAK